MKKLLLVLIVFLTISGAKSLAAEGSRPSCHVCGMYIDQYRKTAGELTCQDGKTVQSCGVACLLRMVGDAGGPDAFRSILVQDWPSRARTPAEKATYVLSSRIVPDMMPSIIAFRDSKEAEAFKAENGGEPISFSQALLTISPAAMTMPVRIKTATVPSQGASGVGIGYMAMQMDTVKMGSDSVEPEDFIQRPGQKMGPKKMKVQGTMMMANYGLTDRLAMDLSASYLEKEMQTYTMGGRNVARFENCGLSDIALAFRYNLFKTNFYNHFTTLLAEISVPTGDFDQEFISDVFVKNPNCHPERSEGSLRKTKCIIIADG